MSLFCKIRNEALICELKNELNSDVLLLDADGFAYFGHLQSIEDCRLAVLTPGVCSATSEVEIVTPGGCLVTVDFLRVDLWSIVGKGLGIVKDPVYCPHPCDSVCSREESEDDVSDDEISSDFGNNEREFNCLLRQVKRLIGTTVAFTTVGGFLFKGVLSDVCNHLAILRIDEIFIPGCSGFVSDHKIRSAVVNLRAISSVSGKNNNCCC